jgi:Heterokaryon incompatibility protein (HET)
VNSCHFHSIDEGDFADSLLVYREKADRNYVDSIITLAAYIGALLVLRFFSVYPKLFIALAAVTSGLFFCIRKYGQVPAFWTSMENLSAELQGRVLIEFRNVVFIIYWTIISLAGKVAAATRKLINTIRRMRTFMLKTFGIRPRKDFSYSELPPLDSTRTLGGKTSPEQEDEQTPKIRLLQLPKRSLWPFQTLRANLEVYDLENPPPYHAISYVWTHGPQDLRNIVLNGMEYRVRGNVHHILSRCSSYLGPRLIWIDTLCINQGDTNEKTLQVRRMRDIYKGAGQVLVCLGEAPSVGSALRLIQELNFVMNTYGRIHLGQYIASFYPRRNYDRFLRVRVEAFLDLLSHPWFERVWVSSPFRSRILSKCTREHRTDTH